MAVRAAILVGKNLKYFDDLAHQWDEQPVRRGTWVSGLAIVLHGKV